MAMAKRLGMSRKTAEGAPYPEVLAALGADALKALGEEYLERTRIHRKLGRPFFVDKMPNNYLHAFFIHLILPNAKIIDARRHPLACCFSCFKQHFARGQGFTYSLEDIGRYYADYVELMAHVDAVLPGRVHRVFYEEMVRDPSGRFAVCSITAACRSNRIACFFIRMTGLYARRVRNKSACRSLPMPSNTGGTTIPGSIRCRRPWVRRLRPTPSMPQNHNGVFFAVASKAALTRE